jgi:hypothetical protein
MLSSRAEGFSCSLDLLYGGGEVCKLQFLIKTISNLFFSLNFFQSLVIKTLDLDTDPDPESMNPGFKVVGNRKIRGVGNLATVRRWFRTVAIDDCLNFNVAVVFSSTYFRLLLEMLSL